jgi:uncharacterized membrane protein
MRFRWKSEYYWIIAIILICVLTFLVDLLSPAESRGEESWWLHSASFFAVLGFTGCLLIIVIAKIVGHYWLLRKEDYYD